MEFSSTEPRLSSYLHARACRSGTPLAGNFELTARCNFNCKMCYVHLTAEEQQRRGRELTADEWLAIHISRELGGTPAAQDPDDADVADPREVTITVARG